MSFTSARAPSIPCFREVMNRTQKELEPLLYRTDREKLTQLADRFFTYLQDHLELFNGADSQIKVLVPLLKPFKSDQLKIELLLKKITQDLCAKNRRVVVPFSSFAALPPPLIDTKKTYANLTIACLKKQKKNFSLSQIFGMCCLLASPGINDKATSLFNLHAMRYFVKDPEQFTKELSDYKKESTGIESDVLILRNLLKKVCMDWSMNLIGRIPPQLFYWLGQDHDIREKPLFEGHQHYARHDYARAFECYKRAADFGSSYGLIHMGQCYFLGRGVPVQDRRRAFECYKQAAGFGNSKALVKMGQCYYFSWGVEQDKRGAFECYKQAADLGNSDGLVLMGQCYSVGWGVEQDERGAFECYKKAADLGNSYALSKIGDCYFFSRGVLAQDERRAFQYYKQAAGLGNPYALIKIGDCYFLGRGVPAQNEKRAFQYYKQAVKFGSSEALVRMGQCYRLGKGVEQDERRAFAHYKKAADLGNSDAFVKMGTCYRLRCGVVERDETKAFECYKQAAELGSLEAIENMGDCYYFGLGVPVRNKAQAFAYWLKAKNLGGTRGALNIAKCLTLGLGAEVVQNREEARSILQDLISKNVPGAHAFYTQHF